MTIINILLKIIAYQQMLFKNVFEECFFFFYQITLTKPTWDTEYVKMMNE